METDRIRSAERPNNRPSGSDGGSIPGPVGIPGGTGKSAMGRKIVIAAPVSKSARLREIFAETAGGPGVPVDPSGPGGIARAADAAGMGYAFAYGRADATPDPDFPGRSYASTRAARRGEKSVSTADGIVSVRIVGADGTFRGIVSVDTGSGEIARTGPNGKSVRTFAG